MSSGTIVRDVYVKNTFMHNVKDRLDEADFLLGFCKERILTLAAMPPMCQNIAGENVTWADYVQGEINDMMDTIVEEAGKSRLYYELLHSNDIEEDM